MKHPTILILFISLHTIIGFVNLDAQPLISFSKNDYKAASQNWSVSCGNLGHMYFGNSSGLLEFDGISWQLYPSPNASIIRTVAVDSARVYTGGYRELGFWERSDNNKLQYFSLADSVKSQFGTNEEFWSIFTTKNQTIFHSFAGIYLYEHGHFSILKTGGFINFATLINDTLYVAIYNEGIYRVDNKQLVPVIEDEFLKDKYVRFIAKNALTGMLYIGTESDGLFSYNSNNGQFSTIAANLQSFFKTNKINHGALTNEGNIIIGTILNGIIAFSEQGEIKYHYNNENGLQSNTVLGISFDRFNNIWLALDAGIEYLANTPVNCYKNYIEKDIGAVYSGALYNGDLFLGTNQGSR